MVCSERPDTVLMESVNVESFTTMPVKSESVAITALYPVAPTDLFHKRFGDNALPIEPDNGDNNTGTGGGTATSHAPINGDDADLVVPM